MSHDWKDHFTFESGFEPVVSVATLSPNMTRTQNPTYRLKALQFWQPLHWQLAIYFLRNWNIITRTPRQLLSGQGRISWNWRASSSSMALISPLFQQFWAKLNSKLGGSFPSSGKKIVSSASNSHMMPSQNEWQNGFYDRR